MPYDPTVWVDDTTPLSAANLNKIEDGIDDAHTTADAKADTPEFASLSATGSDLELTLANLDAPATLLANQAGGFVNYKGASTPTYDGARLTIWSEHADGFIISHDAASVGAGMSKFWTTWGEDTFVDVGHSMEFVHYGGYWNEVKPVVPEIDYWQLQWSALGAEAATASPAQFDTRNGRPCLDFDAGTDEHAVFSGKVPPGYDGNGFFVEISWAATSATSGNVIWQIQFEDTGSGLDLDADSFATAVTATAAAQSASGVLRFTSFSVTGASLDGLAAYDTFRLRVTRDADNGSDTMTGDAELYFVTVEELAG